MHRVKCSLACRLTLPYRGYWSLLELLIIVFEVFFYGICLVLQEELDSEEEDIRNKAEQ